MKQKKLLFLGVILAVALGGLFFITQKVSSSQVITVDYDLEEGTENGDIIQQGDTIINLSRLEQFYKNMSRKTDDAIVVAIMNSAKKAELYELVYVDEQLKLYSDIKIDSFGRKEYKIKLYTGIKKILKNNQVVYILINNNEERKFLSYNLK